MPSYSRDYQSTLIDAFFRQKDEALRNAFRERVERMDRHAQLAQVSGIRDEAVLDRLIELKIEPEALAAIAVVPLVAVAWADRSVQAEERNTLIAAAQAAGIPPEDGRYPMLEYWMNHRPKAELIEAWEHYIRDLCRRLGPDEVNKLRGDVMGLAQAVAEAHGGFLGMGSRVSKIEQAVLNRIEKAFS